MIPGRPRVPGSASATFPQGDEPATGVVGVVQLDQASVGRTKLSVRDARAVGNERTATATPIRRRPRAPQFRERTRGIAYVRRDPARGAAPRHPNSPATSRHRSRADRDGQPLGPEHRACDRIGFRMRGDGEPARTYRARCLASVRARFRSAQKNLRDANARGRPGCGGLLELPYPGLTALRQGPASLCASHFRPHEIEVMMTPLPNDSWRTRPGAAARPARGGCARVHDRAGVDRRSLSCLAWSRPTGCPRESSSRS
jgi:hypothetical protein